MANRLFFVLSSLLVLSCVSTRVSSLNTIPASSSLVTWNGRTVTTSEGGVKGDWVGVSFSLSVSGGSFISANITTPSTRARMKVYVNVEDFTFPETQFWVVPQTTDYLLSIATGHTTTVTVVLNVPPQYFSRGSGYELTFNSFVSDGTFIQPTPASTPSTRRIEFVGDSITAATNVMRPAGAPSCGDEGFQSDYGASYMTQLCSNFSASCSTIAVGGKCMVRQCGGLQMPDYYVSTLYSDAPNPTWPFAAASAPDAMVIHLGTNDYHHFMPSPAFDEEFANTFVTFMKNATVKYNKPDIQFFLPTGPILATSLNGTKLALAKAAAAGLHATWIDMRDCCKNLPWWSPDPNADGCDGCASHPGVHGHHNMFLAAQPVIKQVMGW